MYMHNQDYMLGVQTVMVLEYKLATKSRTCCDSWKLEIQLGKALFFPMLPISGTALLILLTRAAWEDNEYDALAERYWQCKTESLGDTPVPLPHFPPQIWHGLTLEQTRVFMVNGDNQLPKPWRSPWSINYVKNIYKPSLYCTENAHLHYIHQSMVFSDLSCVYFENLIHTGTPGVQNAKFLSIKSMQFI